VASYQQSNEICDALARQLYSSVRWVETVRAMADEGVTLAAECGPGKVLAGLTKRIDDRVAATALISVAACEEFKNLIA
jgi:[acyl-carrier-protein] S-malonyltransferase